MHLHDLTRLSLRYPRTTLAILAAITLALAPGLPRVKPAYGYRVLIGDEHPAIQTLTAMTEEFGGGLPVLVGWSCEGSTVCKSVLDPQSLYMANTISNSLESSAGIRTVNGPANTPIIVSTPDGFAVRTLVENGQVSSDIDSLKELVRTDPLWTGRILSPDQRVAAIELQARDIQDATSEQIVTALDEALAPFRARGVHFHSMGDSVDTVVGGRALAESSDRIVPLTVAAILVVLLLLSRSWLESVVAVSTMGVAYMWTFGLLGWIGWPKDGVLEVLAPLILVFGICEPMHFLARDTELRATTSAHLSRSESLVRAAELVASPCFFTTLTTAAAFLSFTLSALDTFWRFGLISSFAVAVCYLLTFSFLPILASKVPVAANVLSPARSWRSALGSIMTACERRARVILAGSACILIVFSYGWITRLRVDTDWLESWGENSELVRSVRFLTAAGLHSESVEIGIRFPDPGTLYEPGTLSQISQLESSLLEAPKLRRSISVLTILRRVNRMLHQGDPTFERIGGTSQENAQLLELISISEPALLNSWLSFDRRALRISLEAVEEVSQVDSEVLLAAVRETLNDRLPSQWTARVSGEIAMQSDWVKDVQQTQIRSFPSSVLIVFAQLVWFFRSVPLAAAATLPTLIPVVLTLGGMGWVGMSLDVGRTMIAAIIVGIGVDQSIHLLKEYQRIRGHGSTAILAIREALLETGRPIVISTLALALGFLTLLGSAWQTIASFGFFVAASMLGALLATIFVVPSLILVFARDNKAPTT